MKKEIYIISFTFLGFLLQLLIHGLVETWYIGLLVSDFPRYSLGLSWSQWFLIHHAATVVLFAMGILFGFRQGKYWWRRIYEERK